MKNEQLKKRIKRLIRKGNFTINRITKQNRTLTLRALQQNDPNLYYEVRTEGLLVFSRNKLVLYCME